MIERGDGLSLAFKTIVELARGNLDLCRSSTESCNDQVARLRIGAYKGLERSYPNQRRCGRWVPDNCRSRSNLGSEGAEARSRTRPLSHINGSDLATSSLLLPTAGTGVSCYTWLTDKGDFRGCFGRHEKIIGSQRGLVLRRPLYFFNDYHIDERLG
jgi:hypothetical protein